MAAPRSNRRDFLTGKAAAGELGRVGGQIGQLLPEAVSSPDENHYLVKVARRAMACEFAIWLNAGQFEAGTEAAIGSLDLIEEIEAQLTVYRETSEISQLNRTAGDGPVEVESRLFALLRQSVDLWQLTGGAFDITAGPLSELWGFKRREGKLPEQSAIEQTLQRVGIQHLQLADDRQTVQFLRSGMEINLGGIGKGYALDRAAEQLAEQGIDSYLFHGGNSSVLARGSHGGRAEGGWVVGVRNPLRPEQYLGQLILRDRAISTSGSGTQYFIHDGKRMGHIIDPRTGGPAMGVLSVTAIAPTAAEAEAFSTALYVLGPEAAESQLAEHTEIAGLMICPGAEVGSLRVHSWNLTEQDWLVDQVSGS